MQEWWREKLVSFGFSCYEISTAEQVQQLVFQLSTESFFAQVEESDN